MKIKIGFFFLLLMALIDPNNVFSADPSYPKSENAPTLQDIVGRLNLSVPESPAFVALGITPENVIRPGTGKELALGLLHGVDGNGNLQAGIAIEASPYLLANGNNLTYNEYNTNFIKRNLSRLKVSFATAAGQSDADKAKRTSIAIRWTPWDMGDKRLDADLIKCYNETIVLSEKENPPPDTIDEGTPVGLQKTPDKIEKAATECVEAAEKRLWNASSLDIGIAGFSIDDDSAKETGASIWSSLALRIGGQGQFILHGRYYNNLLSEDINSDKIMDMQNGFILSSRLRWGNEKAALLLVGRLVSAVS